MKGGYTTYFGGNSGITGGVGGGEWSPSDGKIIYGFIAAHAVAALTLLIIFGLIVFGSKIDPDYKDAGAGAYTVLCFFLLWTTYIWYNNYNQVYPS